MDYPTADGKSIFYIKRTIGILLLLSMAAVFFYSGYSKIYSNNAFDNFQWSFMDLGIDSMLVAGIVARMMIGLEFMLGLFLLGHIFLRRFTYPAIIGILVVFIIYLAVVIAKQGNTGNCGCFGDKLAMTPLAAIWKNVAMIVGTVLLMYLYPVKPYKYQEYLLMLLSLVAFSTPFLANPIDIRTAPAKYEHKIELDLLYQYNPKPNIDLRKGKHIIAFMSLTCPHCRKAAFLMQQIHRQYPQIPLYMVLDGSPDHEVSFFYETHSIEVPHLLYRHTPEFDELIRTGLKDIKDAGVPTILWVEDGNVVYKSHNVYYQMDPGFMQRWIQK